MADVPTTSWAESTPAGSDNINAGDNRIREMKTQIREVIDVDHDFPSSGQASDVGQHKQVTLQEQADLGTGAVNATILGSQTIGGKGELVYTDEDDNDIQITTGGKIKCAGGALTDAQILVGNGSNVATDVAVSGNISLANTGAMTFQISGEAAGDIIYNNAGTWDTLAKGTAYQTLRMNSGATAPEYVDEQEIYDYGTSASSSTQKRAASVKICYGRVTISGNGSQAITNLPFAGTTYSAVASLSSTDSETTAPCAVAVNSASQITIYNHAGEQQAVNWVAIGI